jgi:hypothetical protein
MTHIKNQFKHSVGRKDAAEHHVEDMIGDLPELDEEDL